LRQVQVHQDHIELASLASIALRRRNDDGKLPRPWTRERAPPPAVTGWILQQTRRRRARRQVVTYPRGHRRDSTQTASDKAEAEHEEVDHHARLNDSAQTRPPMICGERRRCPGQAREPERARDRQAPVEALEQRMATYGDASRSPCRRTANRLSRRVADQLKHDNAADA